VAFEQVSISSTYFIRLHFLSIKFRSSGVLDVETARLIYNQCMCFCQFWYYTRAKVSKSYVSFNLHIFYELNYTHFNMYIVCFHRFQKHHLPRYAAMFRLLRGCLILDTNTAVTFEYLKFGTWFHIVLQCNSFLSGWYWKNGMDRNPWELQCMLQKEENRSPESAACANTALDKRLNFNYGSKFFIYIRT
jgi:hypothetical protein